MSRKIIYNAAAIVLLFVASSYADTIHFKNGSRLDVDKAWEEDGKIKCIMFGNEYEYEREEILQVEKKDVTDNTGVKNKEENKYEVDNSKKIKVTPSKNTAVIYHKKALAHGDRGQWLKAIEMEKQAYALSPNEEVIKESLSYFYTMYANELFQKRQVETALKNLKIALNYTPDYLPAKKGISEIYTMYAQQAYDRRDFDTAEMHLDEASEFYNEYSKIYVLYGKIAYDRDDYEGAKREWLKALEIDPNLSEVRVLLKKFGQEKRVEEKFDENRAGNFAVKFEGTEKQEIADEAIRILNKAYIEVGSELGEYPEHTIPVIIYPKKDVKELDYYPDMAAGLYDGKIRFTEDLYYDHDYFEAVLFHEYTHVIVHLLGGRNVPIWLNEGLAEYIASKYKPASIMADRESFLKMAAKKNVIIPFRHLNVTSLAGLKRLSFPVIVLLYAQSDFFVTYMVEKFTTNDVRTIITLLGNGDNVNNAMVDTLNYSLEDLEKEWKSSLLNE